MVSVWTLKPAAQFGKRRCVHVDDGIKSLCTKRKVSRVLLVAVILLPVFVDVRSRIEICFAGRAGGKNREHSTCFLDETTVLESM